MALNGFRFKQFVVQHDQCAMKVGTDSILLGSWLEPGNATQILDIGTGSGLLAIMLAQKSNSAARITAIDIDENAVTQSRLNSKACPWPEKIDVIHTALQTLPQSKKFDLIVSNPPYFPAKEGPLLTSDPHFIENKRRLARHTLELSHAELLSCVENLLTDQGRCYFVLPEQVCADFLQLVDDSKLHINSLLLVHANREKGVMRRILCLSHTDQPKTQDTLYIHSSDGQYSKEYRTLCKDFYLNF